ncbi:glycosyltransferase family 2 protein [Pedobacter metabolipauper]|uniref:Glycosyltransferase involved in cell wall biosynthesis n=1 Tax=Pedobacter metabolipauper TaxID=425513 RepID=A0A4R6SZ10_9SPHI|nr:glycosyltransferase family 2 protein [Pedobacter metabolipauper]TDQ09962.1 glycosyltransferase involved in cell wall biosynthesis [Pedobacter metabolipauper]
MKNEPLVSIVIPAYNREKYIQDCVGSALNQTYQNIEVIVTDNCSTDNTWNILIEMASKDDRLKIYRNETNIGPVRNWETAISRAEGKYSKILWSDDLMHVKFLEHTVPYLEAHTDAGFAYGKAKVFTSSDQIEDGSASGVLFNLHKESGVYSSLDFIKGIFKVGTFETSYPYSPACALFKTELLKKNTVIDIENDFNINFSKEAIGNDLLMFLLTAIDLPRFAYVDEVLVYFRSHTESISTLSSNKLDLIYHIVKSKFLNENSELFSKHERKIYNTILKRMLLANRNNGYGICDISQLHNFKDSGYDRFTVGKENIKGILKKILGR